MTDVLHFDFCKVHIYDKYIVVIMNQGINLDTIHNNVLLNIVDTYFKNKSFVYITHRLNSYSVDPAIYKETSKIDTLAGFAVVTKDYKAKGTAEIERMFFNKPFEIFDELQEAVDWADKILK
ncbi:hypothetical protein SAMN03097699_0739 [Flavobacteriaceae bacterium MAR_2010_188]|nr:hypothetical protein SAMN03097699_0739 [Flavobacteriaceae bacterium MAR_2010_188]